MERKPQATEQKTAGANGSRTRQLGIAVVFLFLLTVFLISAYTFVLQRNYSKNTLESAVAWDTQCADAIHKLVSNKFTREDYENITTVGDMQSERYQELQKELNELRTLNSTRYLYTASVDEDGRPIYLIDGLDLDAEDFAYPGTYIEKEVVPYIEAALSGETIYSQEIMDTTWGHIFTACYPVRDDAGEIIGALCMEMDMERTYKLMEQSNRTAMETAFIAVIVSVLLALGIYLSLRKNRIRYETQQKQLQEAVVAADAANEAKSAFLFNVSHDIRTPMNAIIGYAELADRNLDEKEQLRGYLEKIGICGQKMLSILDNVLELSRIETGNVVLEESAIEAGTIFDDCIHMVGAEIEKKHQTLTISKDITYPYIYMDTSRFTEIILNLISNAIKYTGEGGTIHCSMRQIPEQKGDRYIQEFSVSDNGIGMSEEFQKHIFESFARERSSTASGIEGTGLGMGIVKKLVDMMDGEIEIHSKVGEGSTFTIRIPCRIATFEDTQPKRAETHLDEGKLAGKRILLAEDNDLNAEIAIALLEEEGLVVERAADGVKCIEMLEKAPAQYYALILMDIQMPILNGYETTRKIRRMADAEKANIPIIAMTANAFAEDRQRALATGMNDHIAKPIDMNKLIPTLQKYISR